MKSVRSTAQLAQMLGLSRWTVSRALNGHPGLDPKTVERIKETARAHGFAPSLLGRGLRSGRTNLVGICLPNIVDYFLTTKISLLERALQAKGLHPLLQIVNGSPEAENAALERFAAMHCAGVVLIASQLRAGDPGLRSLAASQTPAVHIDPLAADVRPAVATDRASAMANAIRHLHELGHRKVMVAGLSPHSSYGQQRLKGLKQGCRKCGWNFERDILILPPATAEDDFSAGTELATGLAQNRDRGTAVIALNDRIAIGMIRQMAAEGLRVPEDISVVGYDNADFSPYFAPPLTTIDPKVDALIEKAVELLLANPSRETLALVRPVFIERGSTQPRPQRRRSTRA